MWRLEFLVLFLATLCQKNTNSLSTGAGVGGKGRGLSSRCLLAPRLSLTCTSYLAARLFCLSSLENRHPILCMRFLKNPEIVSLMVPSPSCWTFFSLLSRDGDGTRAGERVSFTLLCSFVDTHARVFKAAGGSVLNRACQTMGCWETAAKEEYFWGGTFLPTDIWQVGCWSKPEITAAQKDKSRQLGETVPLRWSTHSPRTHGTARHSRRRRCEH
jgi:hypothetical protein